MASNNLLAASASPASTVAQLLHIGTASLAAGAIIRLGDGSSTILTLSTTTLTVGGGLTVSGKLTALGVPVIKRLTADVTAVTTTQVAIAAFDFTPVSGAVYVLEMALIASSVATTTGVQLVNAGGAGTLIMSEPGTALAISAIGGTYAATSAPAAASNFGIQLRGVFTASSTAVLSFEVKSEVAASAVTLKAGSFLKITRIS